MTKMILGTLVFLSFAGCGEVDRIFDCQTVCSRYQTCFDNSFDVGECRSRCKNKADADESFEAKADACESCIDDKSCSESTFQCPTQCVGVVP